MKVAIKKLAESVTTVKNVLDRKLNDEIRQVSPFQILSYVNFQRENDVEMLKKMKR